MSGFLCTFRCAAADVIGEKDGILCLGAEPALTFVGVETGENVRLVAVSSTNRMLECSNPPRLSPKRPFGGVLRLSPSGSLSTKDGLVLCEREGVLEFRKSGETAWTMTVTRRVSFQELRCRVAFDEMESLVDDQGLSSRTLEELLSRIDDERHTYATEGTLISPSRHHAGAEQCRQINRDSTPITSAETMDASGTDRAGLNMVSSNVELYGRAGDLLGLRALLTVAMSKHSTDIPGDLERRIIQRRQSFENRLRERTERAQHLREETVRKPSSSPNRVDDKFEELRDQTALERIDRIARIAAEREVRLEVAAKERVALAKERREAAAAKRKEERLRTLEQLRQAEEDAIELCEAASRVADRWAKEKLELQNKGDGAAE